MYEPVKEITDALQCAERGEELRDAFGVVVRNALLMDTRPPGSPSAGGLPDMIQASIELGDGIVRLVIAHGVSKSPKDMLERIAFSPLVLLAGALLRSQEVRLSYEELERPRGRCQELNASLWST